MQDSPHPSYDDSSVCIDRYAYAYNLPLWSTFPPLTHHPYGVQKPISMKYMSEAKVSYENIWRINF